MPITSQLNLISEEDGTALAMFDSLIICTRRRGVVCLINKQFVRARLRATPPGTSRCASRRTLIYLCQSDQVTLILYKVEYYYIFFAFNKIFLYNNVP